MLTAQTEIRVRYAETDAMGVVYHANYLTWFEMARVELLDDLGVTYKSLEDEGYILPVLDAQLNYRAPAKFDDRLLVRAIISEKPRMKIAIAYEVLREDHIICTGKTVHAFLQKDMSPTRPPKHFSKAVEKHFIS